MSDELLSLSEAAQSIKLGVYEHFKQGSYRVLGIAHTTEEESPREVVVYQSLKTGAIWIRTVFSFIEHLERDTYIGPRFKFISE